MPRFYFDVRAGEEFLPDPEGFLLDSLEAAELEATRTAVTLGRDWLPRTREIRVEIRDDQRRLWTCVSIALTIERAGSM